MGPGDSDSIAVIIADHQDRAGWGGVKAPSCTGWGGAGAARGQNRTGGGGEQTPESEQDSEGETLTAVTQRGKTPSVTRGLLPSAQWDSPHSTLAAVMGAVCPHRRSQAECHRHFWMYDLGTRSLPFPGCPSGSIWDRHQWSHYTTAQSVPLPALPRGCHPPAGAALPGWDPCAQRLLSSAECWGCQRGCPTSSCSAPTHQG